MNLGLAADPGLLQLGEVSDLGARPDVASGPEMTEGPQAGPFFDHGIFENAVRLEHDPVGEAAATHM